MIWVWEGFSLSTGYILGNCIFLQIVSFGTIFRTNIPLQKKLTVHFVETLKKRDIWHPGKDYVEGRTERSKLGRAIESGTGSNPNLTDEQVMFNVPISTTFKTRRSLAWLFSVTAQDRVVLSTSKEVCSNPDLL